MINIKNNLVQAFKLLKEVVDFTGINLIDNYSYREYTAIDILKDYIPSVRKTIGRTGDDASAPEDGYFHIEQKSGTTKSKTMTEASFPDMMFDKQTDPARREYIYKYDGLSLSLFEHYRPYPTAVVFVPKEQVPKLHPLFKQKQDIKVADFEHRLNEGKNIGHDSIVVSLGEIRQCVGDNNLICWLHGEVTNPVDFFGKLDRKEVKLNQ
jgi:hypothetical protein